MRQDRVGDPLTLIGKFSGRSIAALLVLLLVTALCAGPDAQTIIAKSVAANARDFKAAPDYSHTESDNSGGDTKTYAVTMIAGSPYQRLVAVNGKPLSAQDKAKEKQKYQRAIKDRRAESSDQKQKRIADYEKGRRRDHLMMEQLTKAFQFTLTGEGELDSHKVYILKAEPRPGYNPPNMETQVLPGMRGMLWVDKATFQWVKVTAEVIHPVSIEGFLAKVEPGTKFELEKMPVGGIWLPKHFAMHSNAKVLDVFNRSSSEDDHFSNYRRSH